MPKKFIDVSKIRDIPNNQECFIERDGFTSIIFDLLDRVGAPGSGPEVDGRALTAHIEDIVGEDQGEELKVWNTSETKFTRLPENVPAYTLIATSPSEDFKKGGDGSSSGSGRQAANLVFTALIITLIRLEKVKTDVVITINVPHIKGEYDEDDVDLELGNKGELIGKAIEHAAKIWESFAIKNYGLFGREHEHMAYEELG